MRKTILLLSVLALLLAAAAPAGAAGIALDGPDPSFWLSDPEGDEGDNGIEQFHPIAGSSGSATVNTNGAIIRVSTTGLEPGHVYTMWVVYFVDHDECIDGCNGADLSMAPGGVIWGDGKIATANGTAHFTARLTPGEGAEYVGESPPPPFSFGEYEPNENNEFHVVVRSHGPRIPGEVDEQRSTFGGGCLVNVGPAPEQMGDFPVPTAPGECGDVQLFVFS
ncbi:MAG: hypothetical protein OEM97_00745 [Acidimicrobiia bacterium]|nr:hypothetical protein [Acidimicrobiia bacterium]